MALGAVIAMAVAAVIFIPLRINRVISAPFERRSTVAFKTQSELQEERMEALKQKDTDGDGLSDYDELFIFQTSPYLADSDSDGHDDKVEIESGNDPNCPQGQTCRMPSSGDEEVDRGYLGVGSGPVVVSIPGASPNSG